MRVVSGQTAVREQLADLLTDESRYIEGVPDKVFFPESDSDIRSAVETANRENRRITLIGARTGITGGSVPVDGCIAISFSSMNRILHVIPEGSDTALLECEPGITLKEIETYLKNPEGKRFFYPPDPTETGAQLGGTVATNASGARSYRYGPTRAHIEAVSVVLASGETATIKRGSFVSRNEALALVTDQGTTYLIPLPSIQQGPVKNAAGYFIKPGMDLIDLFIGSEGTLAIFSSITIRVRKEPHFLSGLTFFPSRKAAFSFADFLRKEQQVCAIEYFDSTAISLLAEHRKELSIALPDFPPKSNAAILWEFFEDDVILFEDRVERWESAMKECGSSIDATWAGFDEEGSARLREFRHAVPELVNNAIARTKTRFPIVRKVSSDAAVPLERFPSVFNEQIRVIKQSGLHYVVFGHLGDGHLHFNFIPGDDREMAQALQIYDQLMAIAILNNGTVSAEHGIGKLKKAYLQKMFGEESIGKMKEIRLILDPQARLNPGNLFD